MTRCRPDAEPQAKSWTCHSRPAFAVPLCSLLETTKKASDTPLARLLTEELTPRQLQALSARPALLTLENYAAMQDCAFQLMPCPPRTYAWPS